MYRQNLRTCPACREPMSERPPLDLCEHCGGVFLEFFDGEPVALAREAVQEMMRERPLRRDLEEELRCPDCDLAMEQRPYLEEGPEVARCDSCMGLFAMPAQLLALASFQVAPEEEEEEGWLRKLRALFASWLGGA